MAKQKIFAGLEIGTSKTCMVIGEIKVNGSLKILGVGETKTVGVRKGEITDYNQVRICVREAFLQAEEVSNSSITKVILAVTGSHLESINSRGTYRLPDEDREVDEQDLQEVRTIAKDINIPSDNVFLEAIECGYILDDQHHMTRPLGLTGKKLESNFHIIHGIESRLQNSIKCVRETPLEVDTAVFSPIASAQVALSKREKENGALVIDIGGGTTDYVLYLNGFVAASGCIPVGGEHVTNDIHLVLQIPASKAEKIKVSEADVSGDPARSVGEFSVQDDSGFPSIDIDRKMLNDIARHRIAEVLNIVKTKLPEDALSQIGSGVFLTGGSSLIKGISELTEEIFNHAVYRPEKSEISGVEACFTDPQYSTAVGLIRYAQIKEEIYGKKWGEGILSKLSKFLPFGGN